MNQNNNEENLGDKLRRLKESSALVKKESNELITILFKNSEDETKSYDEQIECLNQLIKLDPSNSRAYLGLARVYSKSNQYDKVIDFYKKAINLKAGDMAEKYIRDVRIFDIHDLFRKKEGIMNRLN